MDERLIERLHESEYRMLMRLKETAVAARPRLTLFFPYGEMNGTEEQPAVCSPVMQETRETETVDSPLQQLTRSLIEYESLQPKQVCPVCNSRVEEGGRCGKCGAPADGKLYKLYVTYTSLDQPDSRRSWNRMRAISFFQAICRGTSQGLDLHTGIMVKSSVGNVQITKSGKWFLYREGVKLLETNEAVRVSKFLWKGLV